MCMSEDEFERIIAPVLATVKYVSYQEAIVVCNALGKLKKEINKKNNSSVNMMN